MADDSVEQWALCLSGGGFRATFFHLGVLRFLRETDQLSKVKHVFSVSGGSILAAHLAVNWDLYSRSQDEGYKAFDTAARKLVRFGRKDPRGFIIRRPWRWLAPTKVLKHAYGKLLEKSKLNSLPVDPSFHFLATNLTQGGPFWFERGTFVALEAEGTGITAERDQRGARGSYDLASAVAASSAYPPFFPPIKVSRSDLIDTDAGRAGKFVTDLHLADGGVFDNVGINAAQRARNAGISFDRVIVSDASAPFNWELEGRYWFLVNRVDRATEILMHRVSVLEQQNLTQGTPQSSLNTTWLRIDDTLGQIRTDLDHFFNEEIRLLVWRGYQTARNQLPSQNPTRQDLWDPCRSRWPWLTRLRDFVFRDERPPTLSALTEQLMKDRSHRLLRRRNRVIRVVRWSWKWTRPWIVGLHDTAYVCSVAAFLLPLILLIPIPRIRELYQAQTYDVPARQKALDIQAPQGATAINCGADGVAAPFAVSRDGSQVVLSARSDAKPVEQAQSQSQLYLINLRDGQSFALPGTDGAGYPFFKDDGTAIGFVKDTALWRIAVANEHDSKQAMDGGTDAKEYPAYPEMVCDRCVGLTMRGASWVGPLIVFASSMHGGLRKVGESGRDRSDEEFTRPETNELLHQLPEQIPGESAVLFSAVHKDGQQAIKVQYLNRSAVRRSSGEELLANAGHPQVVPGYLLFMRDGRWRALPFDERFATVSDTMPVEVGEPSDPTGIVDVSSLGALIRALPAKENEGQLLTITQAWKSLEGVTKVSLPATRGAVEAPRFAGASRLAVTYRRKAGRVLTVFARDTSEWRASSSVPRQYKDVSHPVWFCDGSRLAFRARDGDRNGLYWMEEPRGRSAAEPRVEWLGTDAVVPVGWVGERSLLVVAQSAEGEGRLEARELSDGAQCSGPTTAPWPESALAEAAKACKGPTYAALSPRGSWLACVARDRGGQARVLVVSRASGTESATWWGSEPVWRSENELFFRDGDRLRYIKMGKSSWLNGTDLTLDAIEDSARVKYRMVPGESDCPNYDFRDGSLVVVATRDRIASPVLRLEPAFYWQLLDRRPNGWFWIHIRLRVLGFWKQIPRFGIAS